MTEHSIEFLRAVWFLRALDPVSRMRALRYADQWSNEELIERSCALPPIDNDSAPSKPLELSWPF